jgi:hypothetical protein
MTAIELAAAPAYNPARARAIGDLIFELFIFVVLLGLSRAWGRRVERRMVMSPGESFWRFYRRLLWRESWRSFVLIAAIAAFLAFGGQNPEEAGRNMAWIIFPYPILFIVNAAMAYRAAKRKFQGNPRLIQPRRYPNSRTIALIIVGAIGFGAIITVIFNRSALSKRSVHSGYDSPEGTVASTTAQHPSVLLSTDHGDITFPIRKQAWTVARTLVDCGISGEEARRIAMYEMPSTKNVDWWKTQLLPRLNLEQQRMAIRELDRYQEITQKSTDAVIVAHLYELAICKMLEEEKQLSINEIFDLWQAGICNQSEQRWTFLLRGLRPAKQDELNKVRTKLVQLQSKG